MRDPARIDEMVELLRDYWKQNPDLRLGQIICNMVSNGDPFYIEDNHMAERLRRGIKTHKEPPETHDGVIRG